MSDGQFGPLSGVQRGGHFPGIPFLSLAFDVMKQTQGGHGTSLSGPQTLTCRSNFGKWDPACLAERLTRRVVLLGANQ